MFCLVVATSDFYSRRCESIVLALSGLISMSGDITTQNPYPPTPVPPQEMSGNLGGIFGGEGHKTWKIVSATPTTFPSPTRGAGNSGAPDFEHLDVISHSPSKRLGNVG